MIFDISKLVRKNILELQPYSSARDEFTGSASIYLDANENGLGSPVSVEGIDANLNRYPDPYQYKLKQAISSVKDVSIENIFLGNGSDECIDLLFRSFCEPGKDNVIICPPTYGMYEVSANINNVEIRKASLTNEFKLDIPLIQSFVNGNTKLLWICNPNNPTGTLFRKESILQLLQNFKGIVVIDEAYIDFSQEPSYINLLPEYKNLVVLQTFSKAWGLAGLRIGMALTSADIVSILNKVKPPYNISQATQDILISALKQKDTVNKVIAELVENRKYLTEAIETLSITRKAFPSQGNFLLVKMINAKRIYSYLLEAGIVVRDRSNIQLCEGCLRITVGSKDDNKQLIETLRNYKDETIVDN